MKWKFLWFLGQSYFSSMSFRNTSIFNWSNNGKQWFSRDVWGKNLTFKIGKSGGAQAWRPPSVHPLPLVLLPTYKGASPQAPPTPALLVNFWLLDWSPNVFLCIFLSLFHFSPFIHLKQGGQKTSAQKSDSSAITMTSLLHLIDWFIISTGQTDEFSRHL